MRRLGPKVACPRCGYAGVQARGFHDELQERDPAWSRRLAGGMQWFFWGAVVFPVQFALVIFHGPPALVVLVGFCSAVMQAVGMWKLTAPEPSALQVEGAWASRKWARQLGAAVLVAEVMMRGGILLSEQTDIARTMALFAMVFWIILLAMRTIALGYHLQMLAKRVPDDALAYRTNIVAWGLLAGSFVTMIGLFVVQPLMGFAYSSVTTLVCLAFPLLPIVGMYGYGLRLLGWHLVELRESASGAEEHAMKNLHEKIQA